MPVSTTVPSIRGWPTRNTIAAGIGYPRLLIRNGEARQITGDAITDTGNRPNCWLETRTETTNRETKHSLNNITRSPCFLRRWMT